MKKSIALYFDNTFDDKQKLIKIKDAGFDEFFTGINERRSISDLKKQCAFAKSLGLDCTMIHCRYDEGMLHYFWEEGDEGDSVCDDYCRQIESCKGLTKNCVVHLNASKQQMQSRIGLKRIRKLLSVCEKSDINLCIENLFSEKEIPYIFRYIKHEKLKICFDSGHQFFLMPDFDFLKKYNKFVEVLHLHDNHGRADEHLICGLGDINWQIFCKQIKSLPNIVLSSEARNKGDGIESFLKKAYDSLCNVETLI